MLPDTPEGSTDPTGRFEYFMLRMFRTEESSRPITGQVERLGTGEKRRFETADELLGLVTDWPVTTPNEGAAP
jgi:hypothetical protein